MSDTTPSALPHDWETVPLGDHYNFQNGVNADAGAYGRGVPFANVLEVINRTHLTVGDIPGRISLGQEAIKTYAVRPGDVLFNRTSETQEEVGLASVYADDATAVFGGFVIRGRPKDGAFDPAFSGYAFRAPYVRGQIIAKGQGAIRANIGQSDLKTILVPKPKAHEQHAIATALSDADGLIEALESLIIKKRAVKQGAMQELLSARTRLPGFSGEWKTGRLGDLLLRRPSYGINAPAVPYDLRYPAYIRITDITEDGHFNPAGRASVAHVNAASYLLETGDIVLARTGASTGKAYLYRPEDGELVFAGFLIKISANPTYLLPKFLLYQLQTQEYWAWVLTNSMRSGQPGINGQQFAFMPLRIPPTLAEQSAVACVLTDMDDELAALETRLAKARAIKQGMMQELLTGRVRLV